MTLKISSHYNFSNFSIHWKFLHAIITTVLSAYWCFNFPGIPPYVRKCCPFSQFIYLFLCMRNVFCCGLKSSSPIFKMTFWYRMMFQLSLVIFPTRASDSTVSPRNHSSFFWRKLLREDLGTNMFTVTRISLLFAPLRTEPRHVHMCTNIHIHMSIFISEFFIWIYMKNHGFLWISPTPKKTGFIIAYFFICSFLIQHRKTVHSVPVDTIYPLICSNSETVSEFLNNTSVRNTFTPEYNICSFNL